MRSLVFFDANIVIRWGRHPVREFSDLKRLVDLDLVEVVTTDRTLAEVAKRHALADYQAVSQLRRKECRRVSEQFLGVRLPEFDETELRDRLFEHYRTDVHDTFGKFGCRPLTIDDVKPSTVFETYDRNTGLFGPKAKKDQFGDAFVFERLQREATDERPLLIVSDDNDFVEAVEDSENNIRLVKDMVAFYELVARRVECPMMADFLEDAEAVITTLREVRREVLDWQLDFELDGILVEVEDVEVGGVLWTSYVCLELAGAADTILVAGIVEVDATVSYRRVDEGAYASEGLDAGPPALPEESTVTTFEAKVRMEVRTTDGLPVHVESLRFTEVLPAWITLDATNKV